MPKVYTEAPYRDDYDASDNYTQLLAVPGRAEQAREFTQIQSMFRDHLKRLGDTVLKDGAIVEGCTVIISGNQVTITAGKVYIDGLVRPVNGTVLTILGVGNETVGAKVVRQLVTELEDPTLRDPAQGFENHGQAGAHRVQETVQLVVNDEDSSVMYRLQNGGLMKDEVRPELDIVNDVLARRTFDESGNYKVTGLEARDRSEADASHIYLSLTEGKAYVKGFEVIKPTAVKVPLNYSRTTRQVLNEPKVYNSSIVKYKLNNHPASALTQVKCNIEVTDTITRGNIAGGLDYLTLTPAVEIMSVTQGGTTFVKGTDYQLTNDAVDWSLPGADPAIGTQYTVVWRYNKVMTLGTDLQLEVEDDASYIKFLSGDRPVNGTTFDIDYTFYLARKDILCIDSTGYTSVLEGKPDIERLVDSPLNTDESLLELASVLVKPNSTAVRIMNFSVTRQSMEDLYRMTKRIEDLEYNQAITDLDEEAIEGEVATQLRGVYTDGFRGLTKSDVNHVQYDATIDVEEGELLLPSTADVIELSPNTSTFETQIGQLGRVITAPYTEVVAVEQTHATETMLVNPYAVYDRLRLVLLDPNIDNWIDTSTIKVNETQTKTLYLQRWWYHSNSSWKDAAKRRWTQTFGSLDHENDWNNTGVNRATKQEISQKKVLDEAVTYMRQRTVKVHGFNYLPYEDSIQCFFDGTLVPLTPTGSTTSGTASGSIRANAEGETTGTFVVPPNIPCGSKRVELKAPTGMADIAYLAQGRKQVIQNTVLTTTYVAHLSDPLAQSFSVNTECMVTSIGLYFANKDPNSALNVQVRNMVNGYPGRESYGEVVVRPDQVHTSSTGTVETRVTLPNPIHCKVDEQYCVIVMTDSNAYAMFTATLGEEDLESRDLVNSQPYMAGVLFSSSNAATWTAHQAKDLKFSIYKANYTGNGSIVFNDVSGVNFSRLVLASDTLNPRNSLIQWTYSLNDGPWLPIENYVDREISSAVATKVSLKAELQLKDSISPVIAKDAINLIGFLNKTQSTYVSKNIHLDDNYTNLKVYVDFALPSGTSGRVYYASDRNGTTWHELTSPSINPIDDEFSRYEYSLSSITGNDYRIKVVMNTSSPLIKPRARRLMSILKY